jgi:hypothetical protein
LAAREHFRAHGRYRVDLGATLRDLDGRAREVIIRDVGLGGAGLEAAEPELGTDEAFVVPSLDADSVVILEVTAPTLWDPLRLNGKIAWVRRGLAGGRRTRAGVRFEHHDASALYSLFQVIGAQIF